MLSYRIWFPVNKDEAQRLAKALHRLGCRAAEDRTTRVPETVAQQALEAVRAAGGTYRVLA